MIGISAPLHWSLVDGALRLAMSGADGPEYALRGDADRPGNRRLLSVLKRLWWSPPRRLRPLQKAWLDLLRHSGGSDVRLAAQWAMMSACYPFWWGVATVVGRLITLYGSVYPSWVERRMVEGHGDRATVRRAARAVLFSAADWGVLREAGGVYVPGCSVPLNHGALALMAACVLHAESAERALISDDALRRHPGLFAFYSSQFRRLPDSAWLSSTIVGGGEVYYQLRARSSAGA